MYGHNKIKDCRGKIRNMLLCFYNSCEIYTIYTATKHFLHVLFRTVSWPQQNLEVLCTYAHT